MRRATVLAAVAVGTLLLASGGLSALSWAAPASGPGTPAASGAVVLDLPSTMPAGSSAAPSAGPAASALLNVSPVVDARSLPYAFWGVNVNDMSPFTNADSAALLATPLKFLRFPGGLLGEELNYTSNIITSDNGTQYTPRTSIQQFIATCELMHCQAILQMPAEIDEPTTAAYYADYIVHTLNFQPAYWEIGNSPSGWVHFGVPWSKWGSQGGGNITPLPFASLVGTYIAAIKLVDPAGKFLALGSGMGPLYYDRSWVEDLAKIDGTLLTGISVHSYIMGGGPPNPTWPELFANLNGVYSLPDQVTADRDYIQDVCPILCANLHIFVTEDNAAELSTYDALLTSFAGPLYLAAETTQALTLRVSNLDWFCYDCHFPGALSQSHLQWQLQYYLFKDLSKHLKNETLPATVTGPSTFYAAATYNSSGLALMMVNVNNTTATLVNMTHSGIPFGASAYEYRWENGSTLPQKVEVTVGDTLEVPVHSIFLLVVHRHALIIPGGLGAREGPSHPGVPDGAGTTARAGLTLRAPSALPPLVSPAALPIGPSAAARDPNAAPRVRPED